MSAANVITLLGLLIYLLKFLRLNYNIDYIFILLLRLYYLSDIFLLIFSLLKSLLIYKYFILN
jgi:hypothetical protein